MNPRLSHADRLIGDLIEEFEAQCFEQHEALLDLDTRRYNRAYDRLKKIGEKLAATPGDGRFELAALFQHQNAQVRLVAAIYAHPVLPTEALAVVEDIIEKRIEPQLPYAKGALDFLKFGLWKER